MASASLWARPSLPRVPGARAAKAVSEMRPVALAPDFLSPAGGTPDNEDQAREMIGKLDPAATVANAEASLAFLAKRDGTNGKVGAVGFCWGGGLVNRFATKSDALKAGVAYYGAQPPAEDVPNIKAALLLHCTVLGM